MHTSFLATVMQWVAHSRVAMFLLDQGMGHQGNHSFKAIKQHGFAQSQSCAFAIPLQKSKYFCRYGCGQEMLLYIGDKTEMTGSRREV
jgi:HD superfamily phosphohydrolase YqeK